MEKNHYEFFNYNPITADGKLIYRGWYTKDEMILLSDGMFVGLHQFRIRNTVRVYIIRKDGTRDFVHEVRG